MDVVAVLVDLLVALWFLAVIVAIARAWQARLPRPAHFHQMPGTSS